MFTITITQVAPSSQGLCLGLTIKHEKAGWMRFSTVLLAPKDLSWQDRHQLLRWLEDLSDYVPTDEQLELIFD